MRHIARLVVISFTVLRYGLDELALSSFRQRSVRLLVRVMTIGARSRRRAASGCGSASSDWARSS